MSCIVQQILGYGILVGLYSGLFVFLGMLTREWGKVALAYLAIAGLVGLVYLAAMLIDCSF